jgi:hypothetical protein
MIAHYEDTRSNTFFSQLINLKQKGSVTEHIENFQILNIKVTDIPDEHLIDVFIGTLKDNIQHSTFQGLMNSIFKPFLQKFVLVFFDDILIYSKSWEDHVQHVDKVLQLLKEQQLYAKPSKCFFGVKEVEYLGHIVSHEGVNVDPNKIKAMMDWSIPKTLKNLRGFLGLTGYYCKFVQNYGRIVAPLIALTKKDAFSWTPEATKAFEQLKEVMCKALVLTTPDFTKTFIVEGDASGNGIGAVLMQEGRPLGFESRTLKGKDLHKPIYEKEMMAILHALKKWHPYLIGRHTP